LVYGTTLDDQNVTVLLTGDGTFAAFEHPAFTPDGA
jgi:hypothetical protein